MNAANSTGTAFVATDVEIDDEEADEIEGVPSSSKVGSNSEEGNSQEVSDANATAEIGANEASGEVAKSNAGFTPVFACCAATVGLVLLLL